MTSNRRTTSKLSRSEALQCLKRAEEYLAAATSEVDAGYTNVASANLVVAIISAADAVAGFRLGERWAGAHELASKHVARAGADGVELSKLLARAMPFKNRAQYDIPDIALTDVKSLLKWGTRAVEIASRNASVP